MEKRLQESSHCSSNRTNGSKRIPLSLQAVFLNGNRGNEVNVPPPDASAMKVFKGSTRWRPFRVWSSTVSRKNTMSTVSEMYDSEEMVKTKTTPPIRKIKRTKSAPEPSLSPQDYLDGLMHSRKYSAEKYATLQSAYFNKPTPMQLASYGVYIIDMVRDGNTAAVRELLDLGLSPNACNIHGESIVHNVCRRSDLQTFELLIDAGCDIQVSDDNGRTPLHDACWAPDPDFRLIEKILERDKQLLYMMDSRGHLPLSYTRKHHWSLWLQFLQSNKDTYWPHGSTSVAFEESELIHSVPNSRSIRDPDIALTLSLTRMVAGGKLKPKEAFFMKNEFESKRNVINVCNDSDDDSDCSDDSDGDDDDDVSLVATASGSSDHKPDMDQSWNFDEMNDILNSLTQPNRAPLAW